MTMLTYERAKEVFEYNRDTGIVVWRSRPSKYANRVIVGSPAGWLKRNYYIEVEIDREVYGIHRVAWLLTHGKLPESSIDHINGNPSDNRLCNLRDATHEQNSKNRKKRVDNKSGVMGVYYYRWNGKWVATIHANKRRKHIGYFDKIEDAIKARKDAEKEHGYHENHGRNA